MCSILILYYITLENTEEAIKKEENPEKVATLGIHRMTKIKVIIHHNMCWTPLYVNKHKQCKQDMTPLTNKVFSFELV
jgi:hypothetical protein